MKYLITESFAPPTTNPHTLLGEIPSFSSKRGHVTVKHVLTGRKHDKLGNQTFEVLQPLK